MLTGRAGYAIGTEEWEVLHKRVIKKKQCLASRTHASYRPPEFGGEKGRGGPKRGGGNSGNTKPAKLGPEAAGRGSDNQRIIEKCGTSRNAKHSCHSRPRAGSKGGRGNEKPTGIVVAIAEAEGRPHLVKGKRRRPRTSWKG